MSVIFLSCLLPSLSFSLFALYWSQFLTTEGIQGKANGNPRVYFGLQVENVVVVVFLSLFWVVVLLFF